MDIEGNFTKDNFFWRRAKNYNYDTYSSLHFVCSFFFAPMAPKLYRILQVAPKTYIFGNLHLLSIF